MRGTLGQSLRDASSLAAHCSRFADASNRSANYSAADVLAHEGIETYIDSQHAIAHNKIMVIDGRTVLTGSFNFTNAAEANNAENLLGYA